MMFSRRIALFLVTGLVVGASGAQAVADQGTSTAGVLGQLHSDNVREMRMGSMAVQHGTSRDITAFGDELIRDHDAADALVVAFAKSRGITLAANTPPVGPIDLPKGEGFNAEFAKMMVKEHRDAIDQVNKWYVGTRDEKLKSLLSALLPMLEKHENTAQRLVDMGLKS
jgi:putative membrane protein